MKMAKDKRLSELPGISSASVVALERVGYLNCSDLVNADFHRVAYILDDYTEATRIVREARRACGTATDSQGGDPSPPGPLSSTVEASAPREGRKAQSPVPKSNATSLLERSLSQLGAVASIGAGELDRGLLRRRLAALLMLLEHNASEAEAAAAIMLEPVENGDIEQSELQRLFGQGISDMVDECMMLRAIPMLPSGKLPPIYLNSARTSSREARRICAAHLAALADTGALPDQNYLRLHVQALQAAGADELVDAAAVVVWPARQAA
jgi:hypothetical protein